MGLAECRQVCVSVDASHYESLVARAREGNAPAALDIIAEMQASGYSPLDILDGFFRCLGDIRTLSDTQKYEATKTVARYVSTCHACHTGSLQLKLFVLEIFNVVRM
jgi:hypothetical protein